ncbi:MAG TPA: pyridoxal phosphate-dependent aminotransferase family protein [Solirubrobacteraceae bacterium]|nr:pyridoxal phosphate-dependent aminotransferase family protein [Solirubrobacteraceae bacterium]
MSQTSAKHPVRQPAAPVDPGATSGWGQRRDDHWLERWIRSTEDLARLQYSHRMLDAVIDEVDGRRIRVGERWLTDFASSSYLGLDLEREIIDAIPEYLRRWGTHPSWSRLFGGPALYGQIERELTTLLGCEDALVLPTVTHIHMSAIPVLVGGGTLFVDSRAHRLIYDGCAMAQARGAAIQRFAHGNLGWLEALLSQTSWRRPGVICIDGVNSMTGNPADVGALASLAREHDVILYIDDAHGFGVIGERSVEEPCDYGRRGNGIVRYAGQGYENVILVGGFSKAYSSQLAFIACPSAIKRTLKTDAAPYLFSGPSAVASLASALEGLRFNAARGDRLRAEVHRLTRRVLDRVHELGIATLNESGLPIVVLPLADPERVGEVGNLLFDRGIYAAMAVNPLVPRDEVGFRLHVTAANADEQVDHLCAALGELADWFRPAPAEPL